MSLASSGVGAAWNTANISAGNTIAIFGLGAVGLAVSKIPK
jgi:alcohol dehydrogenase